MTAKVKAQALTGTESKPVSPKLTIIVNTALCALAAVLAVAMFLTTEWYDTSTFRGYEQSFLDQTVKVTPVWSNPGSWYGTTMRGVEVKILRTGEYERYPADTYYVMLNVPGSIVPQYVVIKSGDEDKTFPLNVEWHWMEGSFAQKENRRPRSVDFEIVRKSDGIKAKDRLYFRPRGGGGIF